MSNLEMLYLCLLLGFFQVFHFSAADDMKGLFSEKAEAVSALVFPNGSFPEKNHATQDMKNIMDLIENYQKPKKPKLAAYKRSNSVEKADDTDDYVEYNTPENEFFVNVFDYDGLLNGSNWLIFSEEDLEPPPPPPSKFESLKRFFLGLRHL